MYLPQLATLGVEDELHCTEEHVLNYHRWFKQSRGGSRLILRARLHQARTWGTAPHFMIR